MVGGVGVGEGVAGARVPDCLRALLHFIHLFVALCQCVLLAVL